MADWLEEFWTDILSEAPIQVMAAWAKLLAEERAAVYDHLKKMATEAGWLEEQRAAAQAALDAIGEYAPPKADDPSR
jgi:hypothetical protein